MKTTTSKDAIITQKKEAIRYLNNTLEYYLSNQELKKVQLVSKWLIDFSNYVRFEKQFDPKRNLAYKRGDIVKVNFGFNVGSELGGVHYAIVIDNHNRHSSDTLVVVPLSSAKAEKSVYDRDLLIGSEFYSLMENRTSKLLDETVEAVRGMTEVIKVLEKHDVTDPDAKNLLRDFESKRQLCDKKIDFYKKCKAELSMMKEGSVVKIEQIRAVSKIRIWDPKKTQDVLAGIHLSDATMEKINERIKELFIH